MGDFRYMGKSLSGVQRGLGSLTDANISNPQDGDTLVYNGTTGKWEARVDLGQKIMHKRTTANFTGFNPGVATLRNVPHGIDLTKYKILSIDLTSNWAWAAVAISYIGADSVQFLNVPVSGVSAGNCSVTCDVLYCEIEDYPST